MNGLGKSMVFPALLLVTSGLILGTPVELHSSANASMTPLQSSEPLPSAIKHLNTPVINPGGTTAMSEVPSTGGVAGVFTVPPGQVLVLTDIVVLPQTPGPGSFFVNLFQSRGEDLVFRQIFSVPADGPFQLHLTTGLVIASGFSLRVRNLASGQPFSVFMTGFLTADR
jgi:hypothetical protein